MNEVKRSEAMARQGGARLAGNKVKMERRKQLGWDLC
jgi:hypothetical protein